MIASDQATFVSVNVVYGMHVFMILPGLASVMAITYGQHVANHSTARQKKGILRKAISFVVQLCGDTRFIFI